MSIFSIAISTGFSRWPPVLGINLFSVRYENLPRLYSAYYTTYNLLNNTTRMIPRSAICHDKSVAINMNNTQSGKNQSAASKIHISTYELL